MNGRAVQLAIPLVLSLSACGQGTNDQGSRVERLVLAPEGFEVSGTPLEIGFGRSEAGAIAAASKLLGSVPSEVVTATTCERGSAKTVGFAGGVEMQFIDGAFSGWVSRDPDTATADGLRPGAPYAGSGLETGPTFTRNGVNGRVDDAGRIAVLFSGNLCQSG